MKLEDRIATSIGERIDLLGLPGGDLDSALRLGVRIRGRRRRVASAAGAVAVVLVGLLALVPDRAEPPDPAAPHGTWERLATPPLSPRIGALLGWTGREVLVVAGKDGPPCFPAPGCVGSGRPLRDGAAFDPATGSWRRIARSPAPVWSDSPAVMAGDTLVVGLRGEWLTYDATEDVWRRVEVPRGVGGPATSSEGTVFALDGPRVWAHDLAAGAWTRIPSDPLRPRLQERALFATDTGLVLTGTDRSPVEADRPYVRQADVWNGSQWRRLPPTGQVGPFYNWDGSRLVGLRPDADHGLKYPYGGALDPVTGSWEPLPEAPTLSREAFPVIGPFATASWMAEDAGPVHGGTWFLDAGLAHNSATGTWWEPGRPEQDLDWGVAGVWAGDRLVTFGGYDEAAGFANPKGLSNEAWLWTP